MSKGLRPANYQPWSPCSMFLDCENLAKIRRRSRPTMAHKQVKPALAHRPSSKALGRPPSTLRSTHLRRQLGSWQAAAEWAHRFAHNFWPDPLEHYALGPPTPDVYNGLDYSDVGLRAKLWSTGEWVFSGEATVFIPGAHNPKAPAEEGDTGVAGEARLNVGRNFTLGSIPGFVDAELAYRLRTAGPPDEWHGDLTVGFKFTPKVMLMLQDFTTVSMATTNRNFPAWRSSTVEASLVYALNDKWSIQVGVFSTVWTVKTNSEHGAVVAVWWNF